MDAELNDLLNLEEDESASVYDIEISNFPERLKNSLLELETSMVDDYNNSRENNYQLLENAQEALKGAVSMANMNPSPRSYEVVSQLIKTVSELNNDLITRNKNMKELSNINSSQEANTINNIQNNVSMTSVQLLDLLDSHNVEQ